MRGPPADDARDSAAEPAVPPTLAARVCPYSRDTVTACPFYQPVSEHGSGPDAAMCRYVVAAHSGTHVRTLVCVRAEEGR